MNNIKKQPLLTFISLFKNNRSILPKSCFQIEGEKPCCFIPSAILRRNFPQAKTNTRLKVQFYPWEIDVGRTIWFKDDTWEIYYTFSRRGKVVRSPLPYKLQTLLKNSLGIKDGEKIKLKISVTAI
jgi:hypothetical protein